MKLEWLSYPLIAIALTSSVAFVYGLGQKDVQAQWDKDKQTEANEVIRLTGIIRDKEAEHQELSQRNSDDLVKANQTHQAAMDALRSDLSVRLQHSETRTGIYQRQSQGTALERDRLAIHAAELDRTLEEGRALVSELRETLGLRELAIRALSNQIAYDRNLFSTSEAK